MKIFRNTVLSLVISLLTTTIAFAQSVGDRTVGGGLSIFGATLESTYRIETNSRLRGVLMGGVGFDDTQEDDDGNRYDVDLDLAAAAVLLDFYPDSSGWRVSGGLLMNMSDVEAEARGGPSEPFEINGETFSEGIVVAEARFANDIAPIVTGGYDYDFGNDWIISGEIGAIYIGGIKTEFTANSVALQDAIDADAEFQRNRRDAEDIKVLPYLSVAVSFRF